MTPAPRLTLVLAVKPTHRGFGWVAFEGPFAPYDWGIVETRREKNVASLRVLEKLIDRLAPEVVLFEAPGRKVQPKTNRIARLTKAMMALAADRGLDVCVYGLGDVKACFASVGARTRHEIADAVARHIDAFRHRLPRRRQPWDSEDRRMGLFSAAALVLTHFQLGGGGLFDDLNLGP